MPLFRNPFAIAVLVLLTLLSTSLNAADFCVDNAADLRTALTTAAANGEDDQVQIVQGTYVRNFVYTSTEGHDLSVQGGFTAGCTSREIDPTNTVLDGNWVSNVLVVSAPNVTMDLLVHGVTLRNGYPASLNSGGGFYANVGSGSRVTLESNSLEANTAPANGGGAYVSAGGGTVTFTSNSIQGNTCAFGGGAYVSAGTVTFTNNSIEGNAAFRSSGSPYGGGLRLRLGTDEASASATLYNNVFWNNVAPTGADLYVGNDDDNDFLPTPVTLLHNNFDQQPGGFYSDLPITIHRSNFDAVDPLFVDAANGDLHLSPDSWMIDAGDSARPDLPEFDLDGTPRVLGASVDIGAYEYDDGSDSRGILVVIQAGTGSGRVTSTPTGIDCGDDCTEVFVLDSTVSLDATPDAGSMFYGWSGDTDCDDGMLTMDRNKSCTATFNVIAPLQITKAGSGDGVVTSDLPGIQCGEDCTADFPVGSTITLTADANPGSEFVGWDGGTCCRGTCVVDIDQVKDVTATFKLTSDVNGDGVVNSLDVQMVINHALGTVE